MTPEAYVLSARKLLTGQPSDVDLRRAVSTAYYAMFHHLSRAVFSQTSLHVAGAPLSGGWIKVYRSMDHRPLCNRCDEARNAVWGFSKPIVFYAEALVRAYKARIDADYDPSVSFSLADATVIIDAAELAMNDFDAASADERRALLFFVSLRAPAR
jgi:uncharacterized protein (UPF0332 family)